MSETVVFHREKNKSHVSLKKDTRRSSCFLFVCVRLSLSVVASHVWSEDESAEKEDGGERRVGFDRE